MNKRLFVICIIPAVVLATQREQIGVVCRERQVLNFYFVENETSVNFFGCKVPNDYVRLDKVRKIIKLETIKYRTNLMTFFFVIWLN